MQEPRDFDSISVQEWAPAHFIIVDFCCTFVLINKYNESRMVSLTGLLYPVKKEQGGVTCFGELVKGASYILQI